MSGQAKFAATPVPPYYAVVFTAKRTGGDNGYTRMLEKMIALVEAQPGYLGRESARDPEGFGITVSYWKDAESVAKWKAVAEHHAAQVMGHNRWYEHYELRVARVERAYAGPDGRTEILAATAALK